MYEHSLKVIEDKAYYHGVILDGKVLSRVNQVKIERELNPMKENELNKVIIRFEEFPDGENTTPVEKEVSLEKVKLEFIQAY